MSPFWSAWIMFLVVLNLGITLFLFIWGQCVKIPVQPDGTSGHVWAHGVLREGVRTLPLWWVVLSASMFVVGFAYLWRFGYLDWIHDDVTGTDRAVAEAQKHWAGL